MAVTLQRYESEQISVKAIVDAVEPFLERVPEIYGVHAPSARQTAILLSKLVHGVMANTKAIDLRITELSGSWSLDRQAAVDRNILRLGAFGLIYDPKTRTGPTISGDVELAQMSN